MPEKWYGDNTYTRMAPNANNYVTSARPNSVNLRAAALEVVFDAIEAAAKNGKVNRHRNTARWPFRREGLEVNVVHPGGTRGTIRVACRNLSRGGLSVLHSSFLYPGTECSVLLPHPTKGDVPTPAKIVRCTHYKGVIHELGIAFNSALNAREFAVPDPLSNCFCFENIKPEDLKGRLLLIDPSPLDRDIFRQFLRETLMSVEGVSNFAEGVLACTGRDVVVLSAAVADADPLTGVTALRQGGYAGPIVIIVPDTSPATRARVLAAPAQVYLTAPITQDLVHRALAEALMPDNASPMLINPPDRLQPGTEDLAQIGAELLRTAFARDAAGVRSVCSRVGTISQKRGWSKIQGVVEQLQTQLSKGGKVEEAMPLVQQVMAVCDSNADLKTAA